MISVDKVEAGISQYVDKELLSDFPDNSVEKIAIGVGIAIKIRRKLVPMLKTMDLIDDEGMVDVDLVKEEFEKRIPKDGMVYENSSLDRKFTFFKEDISKLYEYITDKG